MDNTIAGIARALGQDVNALDLISQNVANMQTPGYLTRHLSRNFAAGLYQGAVLDLAAGALKHTGRALDLAVQGNAFFAIEVGEQTLLTRNGEFHIDDQGQLVTAAGHPVLGDNGPIKVSSTALRILPDGQIEDRGRIVDRLRLVAVSDPRELVAVGGGLYGYSGPTTSWNGAIQTGALEQANVDPGGEMVRLIEVTRHVQSLQHAMHAYDEALQTGINHLGDNN
jgi:flagellar basal body rod protein FlgG